MHGTRSMQIYQSQETCRLNKEIRDSLVDEISNFHILSSYMETVSQSRWSYTEPGTEMWAEVLCIKGPASINLSSFLFSCVFSSGYKGCLLEFQCIHQPGPLSHKQDITFCSVKELRFLQHGVYYAKRSKSDRERQTQLIFKQLGGEGHQPHTNKKSAI